jgi:hypothetical protein
VLDWELGVQLLDLSLVTLKVSAFAVALLSDRFGIAGSVRLVYLISQTFSPSSSLEEGRSTTPEKSGMAEARPTITELLTFCCVKAACSIAVDTSFCTSVFEKVMNIMLATNTNCKMWISRSIKVVFFFSRVIRFLICTIIHSSMYTANWVVLNSKHLI